MDKGFSDLGGLPNQYYPNVPDLSRHKHSDYQGIYLDDKRRDGAFRSVEEDFERNKHSSSF